MVKLAILWHMHQPFYEDLATGEHILPWVRLHAIKDYVGMVRLLDEFPGVQATFNLVPSLLVQVQAFADNRAQDRHLYIGLKPAADLDLDEQAFLVANGFHTPDRMIRPYPRYAQLCDLRRAHGSFTIDDLRDLQVWHKLAWMDPDLLTGDVRLTALVEKGRDFEEADKQLLRGVELELLAAVIPAYQAAATRGQVELSTSPYYHPILPLVCDTDAHFRAHPHSVLPRGLFKWPADGREQLTRAIRLHTDLFGTPPQGVWPSEGSVSDEAVRLLDESGVTWVASDEGILARSLGRALRPEELYRPYEVGNREPPLRCLFRDHGLSDLVGFSYQSWDADAAADDFVRRIRSAGASTPDPTITVILDGENAWEHYAGGGRPFLRALYSRLQQATDITTLTMSAAAEGKAGRLERVFPGSWINSDFYIWAGHADDHRGWAQLAEARRTWELRSPSVTIEARERAYEELLIAEGSDWFWWYGDDHSSSHDQEFDELFRRHLRNVYRALELPVPDALWVSNITSAPAAGPLRPRSIVRPTADGEVTGFAEWAGATTVPLGGGGSTMQRVASGLVREIRIGFAPDTLSLRVDGPALIRSLQSGELGLALLTGNSSPHRIDLGRGATDGIQVSVGSIAEIVVDRSRIPTLANGRLSVSLLVTDPAGNVVEQHPARGAIEIEIPAGDLDAVNWTI